MVSTRGIKQKFFEGERVLCYEPDPTKAKVLYDSKVLGVVETKDKRGRKTIQYKIHFQGWNSSWDRKVNSDYVLKDTEENRQLQRDLAEKAQLQLAAYLYRRERKKQNNKKENVETSPKNRNRGSVEDDSSCSTFERNDTDFFYREEIDCDTESYCSSVESLYDEERVFVKIGEKLKQYLDNDYNMIVKNKKLYNLPANTPAITILENFVKQSAIKMVFCSSNSDNSRKRISQLRTVKREKDLDKLVNTISVLKEVVDGIRLYLNFTIKEYLLYNEEKSYVETILSEENLEKFPFAFSDNLYLDNLNNIQIELNETIPVLVQRLLNQQNQHSQKSDNQNQDNNSVRRKLRSHKNEDNDFDLGTPNTTPDNNSDNSNTNNTSSSAGGGCSSNGIPTKINQFLQDILSWHIIPSDSKPEPSMILGAVHLARLIVKLPDFLNSSTISDEKLKVLLQHLDSFATYIESQKEWFDDTNYNSNCQQLKVSK